MEDLWLLRMLSHMWWRYIFSLTLPQSYIYSIYTHFFNQVLPDGNALQRHCTFSINNLSPSSSFTRSGGSASCPHTRYCPAEVLRSFVQPLSQCHGLEPNIILVSTLKLAILQHMSRTHSVVYALAHACHCLTQGLEICMHEIVCLIVSRSES